MTDITGWLYFKNCCGFLKKCIDVVGEYIEK